MEPDKESLPGGKARLLQVAKTMFFVLLMVGRKESWEKGGDAARMTPGQIAAGAIMGSMVVIAALIGLVKIVLAEHVRASPPTRLEGDGFAARRR